MEEETTIEDLKAISAKTFVVSDAATRRPIAEIVEILRRACPHWAFSLIPEGGHMAPLTRPDIVNPIVSGLLQG
jgi:pimeloyl-ACP methyl ester carboxylesterase